MTRSIAKGLSNICRRFVHYISEQLATRVPVYFVRVLLAATIVAGVMVYVPTRNAKPVRFAQNAFDCPRPNPRVDLAFIIDRSGSLDKKVQGQTYNIEIEGVRRAMLDPGVIPRDGSTAVAVFTFAGQTILRVPFTVITSAADAAAFAITVEGLKCVADETCPQQGPNPETLCGPALLAANDHLNQNRRAGARRVLVVSTDGGFTDPDFAATASNNIRQTTAALEIPSEIDVILMGSNPDKMKPEAIVFPEPTSTLPSRILTIAPDACNQPGASEACADLSAREVIEFAEDTRRILRSSIPQSFALVNTEADAPPGSPVIGKTLSLRQAIEIANRKGGSTTITFAQNVRAISPLVPLPALTSPEITIDGIAGCEASSCPPSVTIDGLQTDPAKGEQHSDGILLRSNRCRVRGLRFINFKRAGIGVEPLCQTDNVGFNRIELNTFENNIKAGVCVVDPPVPVPVQVGVPNGEVDQANAVFHNVSNTISRNNISGSETPIDLGCDGATQNDAGDLDDGPNTLLNFPDRLEVAGGGQVSAEVNGVSLAGQVNGPTAAGATVEIFAITGFRAVPGGRVIDGVIFAGQGTTDSSGMFVVSGVPNSPTCGYTATVTDVAGNTSEMMFPCGGFAKAKVTNLDFGGVAIPNQNPQTGTFTIENTGCAALVLKFGSITRDGFPIRHDRNNDILHFSIQSFDVGSGAQAITIQTGQMQQFTANFDPAIPKVKMPHNKPPAKLVLPATVRSTVTLIHNGCTDSDRTIGLTGHVDSAIKLIDPDNPRNAPVVTLERSEDVFTVTFYIYDSSLDVDRVTYQFFDQAGRTVELDQPLADLSQVVQQANLVTGQSFSVMQKFTNAKQHKDVARVLVTVFDKGGSKDMAFGSLTSQTAVSTQSSSQVRKNVVVLPVTKLTGARQTSQ
jgi:hypothetical protein